MLFTSSRNTYRGELKWNAKLHLRTENSRRRETDPMALAHRPPRRRPRYGLDINYCTSSNSTLAICQVPIIYKVVTICNVTILQRPGAANGNHHHHRRCGICLWPVASPRCYHSTSSWSTSLMSQMSNQRFFQREKMSVTLAFKCFNKWFCQFYSMWVVFQICKSHLSKLLNKLYTPNKLLNKWFTVGEWMSELYTWQNCSVWCKKCVENLEHDFEILCKKRLLHGQLKLNCTKCDKVMQWKVRFKTSLFTTSQKVMFEQKKRKFSLIWCAEYRLLST